MAATPLYAFTAIKANGTWFDEGARITGLPKELVLELIANSAIVTYDRTVDEPGESNSGDPSGSSADAGETEAEAEVE